VVSLSGIRKEQAVKHELQEISREINSLKRRLVSLEKQKIELTEIEEQAKT